MLFKFARFQLPITGFFILLFASACGASFAQDTVRVWADFEPSLLEALPLDKDPKTDFEYSNMTSHLLGVIVARSGGRDLRSFAEEYLFSKMNVEVGE